MAPVGQVACYDRSRFNDAVAAHGHTRHDNRARPHDSAVADIRMAIKTTGSVMGQNDGMMIDQASRANVDALWPRAVDQRCRCDPGCWMDIHNPQLGVDQPLPLLQQCAFASG